MGRTSYTGSQYSKRNNVPRRPPRSFRPSSSAVAAEAFKSGQVVNAKYSAYFGTKTSYGIKQYYIISAGATADIDGVSQLVQDTYVGTGSPTPDFVGVRNYKTTLFLKNVSTYQLRLRVTTWVCRHNLPNIGGVAGSIQLFLPLGFLPPYVKTIPGNNTLEASDVSSSLFMNPLWCYYFKALKVKNYKLMPYRTVTERLHILKRKPGLIRANITSGESIAFSKSYGITTCYKTIEIVGEIANDAEPYPGMTVFTSPGVLLGQLKTEFEAAGGQAAASVYGVGDADPEPGIMAVYTGQPWNYMFPTPGTSSAGTSSVVGALTAGV